MCARGDAGCIVDTPCKIYYGLVARASDSRGTFMQSMSSTLLCNISIIWVVVGQLTSKCLKLSLKGSLLPTPPSLTNNSTASLAL